MTERGKKKEKETCMGVSVREIWDKEKKGYRCGWEKEGNWDEKKKEDMRGWEREIEMRKKMR